MAKKRGNLNIEEIAYVHANMDIKTDEEMAKHLNRSVELVRRLRVQSVQRKENEENVDAVSELHVSYFWSEVRRSLMANEERYFEQQWIRLHEQFSQHGVLPTDEIMMKDLILHEIASNRVLANKRDHLVRLAELERMIDTEMAKPVNERDLARLPNWETQRGALQVAITAVTREHLEYQKKKDDKMEQLKATRSQRLKQAEQSGSNFWQMIRELDKPENRRIYGNYMMKMKIAADNIRNDWNQVIEYANESVDKPFLSPEGEIEDEQAQIQDEG
jgi:hypothetical protein